MTKGTAPKTIPFAFECNNQRRIVKTRYVAGGYAVTIFCNPLRKAIYYWARHPTVNSAFPYN